MKLLRLIVLLVCCRLTLLIAYSQNCPPGSPYPNPQIVPSFAPDSSCLDSARNGTQPDDKHSCLGACELSYTSYCTMLVPGDTYLWTVVGGTIVGSATSNCVTVLWGPAGPGTISITETTAMGCVATKEQCVKIIDSPVAAFSVPSNVCKNVPLNFINQSLNALTYFWNFGDGNTSTAVNPTHAYTTSGPKTITLVAYNKCGCKDSVTHVVTVSTLDGPVITCPATVCAGAKACYSTTGCPTAVYNWTVNGGIIVGPTNQSTICVQWGPGPQGTVSVYVTGCGNVCQDTTTVIVPIISTNGPITGNLVVCPSTNEVYTLPLWPGTYYNWVLSGGGNIISGTNTNAIQIHWGTTPGTYTLTATWNNILLGCGGTSTIMINVRDVFQMFGLPGPFCIGSTSSYFASANANWTVTGGTFTGNGTNSIVVTWTTGGAHTVTAVPLNPSLFCNPSVTMNVTVTQVPPAVAITGPPVICPGGTYQYTATPSGPGFTFLWTVTGGTIIGSPSANPVSVMWSGPGTISVKQVMTVPPYCASAPISIPVTVLSIPNITGSNVACMDQTSIFTAGGPNPGIVYTWSIVDGSGNPSPSGSIVSGQGTNQITVLWHGPGGPAVVKLKVCASTLTFPVTVNPKPTPTISMTGKVCNPGGQVILTSSVGNSYQWNTGANTQQIIVTAPGSYWVKVTNAFGCSDTARITVPVSPGPVASISTPNPTSYCSPPPPFVDTLYALQGPGYTYLWSPGNQTTPTITVSATGTYFVVVTDANGCSSVSNPITITSAPCTGGGPCTPTGTISFTITQPVCNPVQFNGSTTGGITSTSWNFGDPASLGNNTSALTNPTHLFTQAGWYTVTYSGLDPSNCPISVSHPVAVPLAADFSFAGVCGVMQFTDLSTFLPPNSITSWNWTFTGGTPGSSTAQNPSSTFTTPGPHNVTLTVSNGTCIVSITKTVNVSAPPSAAFILPATACAGTDVPLSGSGAPVVNWLWNFGDSATSGLQNTSHAWAVPGTYVVSLTVKDSNGCTSTVMHSITITAPSTNCPINPTNPPPICAGGSVLLTSSPASGYQWQLNGVNIGGATLQTYSATVTGTYTVIDTDAGGCICISPPVSVVVNPLPPAIITPSSTPVICGSGLITLNAPAGPYSYLWSDASTTQSITVLLNTPGAYTYTVTVTDSNSPPCSAVSAPFTVNVYPVPPPPVITASGPTALCKGDSVTLTSSYPTNNVWNTGATTQSITVTLPGVYTVTVTTPHGCSATGAITVTSNVPNLSLYPFGCDLLCDSVKIPGPIGPFIGYYTYQWFFNNVPIPPPNGTNDTLTPIGSGTYTLILTGPGPTFCKDTSGPYNLTLKDCDSLHCHGKLCGRKWNDANGNHKFNYGTEVGIANWRICLVKCNIDHYPTKDTIACTMTDSLGFYCFYNLCAGEYCVVEEGRPGWQQTWPVSPPFYHVTITDSGTISGLDFGNKKKWINIIITHDTVGIGHDTYLTAGSVIPTPYPWPVKISYLNSDGATWRVLFDGFLTDNISPFPNTPIPSCVPGTYSIVRKEVGNYKFDRIYLNDSLRSDHGDSIVVSLPDSTDGATIIFLNVFDPDTTLRYRTFTLEQLADPSQVKPVKRAKPGKPVLMPNTANVIDEVLKQGGSLLVGSPDQLNSAGKVKGYLMPHSQSDVFKTFNTKGFLQTGKPRGFDFIKGKPILKRQKSLPATKFNNRLMANLLALQVNIAASETDPPKTPAGFGDLVYDNGGGDPLEGMTLNDIADYASDLMTNWEYNDTTLYINLNTAVELINGAFSKPLPFDGSDTAVWIPGKLQLRGAKALMDVPFLKAVMGNAPTTRKIKPTPASLVPSQFVLYQNYPNPFNPTTTISFSLPSEATVTLRIYNVLGQVVATLINREVLDEGDSQVEFDAHRLSSGVYFYQLSAETTPDAENGITGQTYFSVKKMLLVR